jgi:hypothetical protein
MTGFATKRRVLIEEILEDDLQLLRRKLGGERL